MPEADMKTNPKTSVTVLPAFVNLPALQKGMQIHEKIIRRGFLSDVFAQNALGDMYAKCGSIERAPIVFDKMSQQSMVSLMVMIAGYAMCCSGEEALKLFEQMQCSRIHPDHATYLCVLSACCHAGVMKEGRHHFDHLSQYYHLDPAMEHYSCMVGLFGRVGYLEKAHNFITKCHRNLILQFGIVFLVPSDHITI